MFDILYLLPIAIAVVVAAVATVFWGHKNTLIEGVAQILIIVLIITPVWFIGRFSDTWDTELWNGEITNKQIERQSCPQYWRDFQDGFCTEYKTRRVKDGLPRKVCTGTGKDKRCTSVQDYKTQYYYIYPWEQKFWMFTNIKTTYSVPRVDRQGAITPPDYLRHYVGEPASDAKGYTNFIRAASKNIFYEDGDIEDKYKDILPAYPLEVYDYGRVNRVVRVGNVPLAPGLNEKLAEALKTLGPNKQMNAIIVLVDAKLAQADFSNALRRYWMGFKKNDAVVFVGLDGANLAWAEVMSWSKKSIFDIDLRDSLLAYKGKPIDLNTIPANLLTIGLKNYERREMKEFEYLKAQIPVPTWLTILVFIVSLGGSVGLTWLFHNVEFDPIKLINRRNS